MRSPAVRWSIAWLVILVVAGAGSAACCAAAQGVLAQVPTLQREAAIAPSDGIPREVENVTVEQKLGGRIRLDLPLTDSLGRKVTTGHFFDGKRPTIVTLNYSNCPMLCSIQLNQLTKSLGELDLQMGKDFQLLTVSIDPKETTETIRRTKDKYIEQLVRVQPGAAEGWEFCTAQQPIITNLADALGFRYTFDRRTGEYYHPAMLAFVSPDGVISRYSLAVAFEPADMKKALVEAGQGTVGTAVDQFVLWCFSYDPSSNSYVPQAWRIMRLGSAATIGVLLACLAPYWIGRKRLPSALPDETDLVGGAERPPDGDLPNEIVPRHQGDHHRP
jgi:protein SCO1/2